MNTLPEVLRDFLRIEVVEDGAFFAGDLFRRKYGHPPPDFGRHIVVFHRGESRALHVASYLHVWTQGSIGLTGGACTDGEVIRRMSAAQRSAIESSGGILAHTLAYAFVRYEKDVDAFFGHCGDRRALEVIPNVGLLPTEAPHLFVRWSAELDEATRRRLIDQAVKLGPF